MRVVRTLVLFLSPLAIAAPVHSQESDADALAKSLSNPVSALISVPLQYNFDETFGSDGYRHTLNIQPVVPVSISGGWNLISRTIVPVMYQKNVVPGSDKFGLGDITQSFFFSPKEPTASGLIWGVGPAALLPAGDGELGNHTWAIGPTAVVLKQQGPWTYGALVNHLVDVGGDKQIESTFMQPFLARGMGAGRTLTFNFESTYDWEAGQWTIPMNITYSKVSKIGNQRVSYAGGVRAYLDKPAGGPDWGLRFVLTLLYPKGS